MEEKRIILNTDKENEEKVKGNRKFYLKRLTEEKSGNEVINLFDLW